MATYISASRAMIHAGVSTVTLPTIKSWSSYEGGDLQGATSVLQPGGMVSSVAMPGPATRTNVTVKRPMTDALQKKTKDLEKAVGRYRAWASYTTLDNDGNPNGPTVTRNGFLKEVQTPTWDAKAGEPAYLGLVLELDQ